MVIPDQMYDLILSDFSPSLPNVIKIRSEMYLATVKTKTIANIKDQVIIYLGFTLASLILKLPGLLHSKTNA